MRLQRQIDQLLARRASEWHQILEDADPGQRAEFVAWLKQSPQHVREYLETSCVERMLGETLAGSGEDVQMLMAQADPAVVALTDLPARSAPSRPRTGWRSPWAMAAGFVALSVLGVLGYLRWQAGTGFSTAIGEQRTLQLADASVVSLNADSRIRVRMEATARDIDLLQGEALFVVARDPARPFRVRTRSAIVEAVGTEFNVHEGPTGTRVSVIEGRVNVTPRNGAGNSTSKAHAPGESLEVGQEVQVRPDGNLRRHAQVDVGKTLAWRERRLIFEDTPLEEMVREFNRYNQALRLEIEGVVPGTHHYNGIFDASDPGSVAELLSREPDLDIERTPKRIVIRGRRGR